MYVNFRYLLLKDKVENKLKPTTYSIKQKFKVI